MNARHDAKVKRVFRDYDADGNGSLNKGELGAALIAVGAVPEGIIEYKSDTDTSMIEIKQMLGPTRDRH